LLKKYFGTDGIRGEANSDLTPELAMRLGRAAVRAIGGGRKFVLGRDTRISGRMLESALTAGLLSEGADVLLLGILPTPGVAFLTEELGADVGIVISASHNQFKDNGIKLFGPGGMKLPDDTEKAVEHEFEDLEPVSDARPVGTAHEVSDASRLYVHHLLNCVDADLSGLKVALDCANGAAYMVAPEAFRRLGAEAQVIGAEPDGININMKVGSTHPQRLAEMVTGWGADAGFALDGDADRCICVDETGEVRDGDFVMAIAARYLKESELLVPPMVVSTVMSNLGFFKALEEMGIEAKQVQVGDRYVLEEMLSSGSLIGGEQSGHIIFREHASTGDGTLTAMIMAGILKESGAPLSEMSEVMKKYPQVLINVTSRSGRRLEKGMKVWELISSIEEELGSNGRVLVRSSGTEPVERVMVEASTERRARAVAERIAEAISQELDRRTG
jgi:phosphoglucosamine mutase